MYVYTVLFFLFAVLRVEFSTSHILGKRSTTDYIPTLLDLPANLKLVPYPPQDWLLWTLLPTCLLYLLYLTSLHHGHPCETPVLPPKTRE